MPIILPIPFSYFFRELRVWFIAVIFILLDSLLFSGIKLRVLSNLFSIAFFSCVSKLLYSFWIGSLLDILSDIFTYRWDNNFILNQFFFYILYYSISYYFLFCGEFLLYKTTSTSSTSTSSSVLYSGIIFSYCSDTALLWAIISAYNLRSVRDGLGFL